MWLKKGDITGLVIVIGMIALIGLFLVFAPKAPEVSYLPVELTGSALKIQPFSEGWDFKELVVDVTLKQKGFVSVHPSYGAAPGPSVSVSPLLEPGTYTDYAFPVTLEADLGYIGLLFVDDGDGVYESGIDLPVMSDGQVVKESFITPL